MEYNTGSNEAVPPAGSSATFRTTVKPRHCDAQGALHATRYYEYFEDAFLYWLDTHLGRMGVVAPVSGVGAALVPVFVGVSLGERLGTLTWIGVLVALPGIYFVSREVADGTDRSWGGIVDGALAGLGFGLMFVSLPSCRSRPESCRWRPVRASGRCSP